MIDTFSVFYYNFDITSVKKYISFKEGAGPELVAEIQTGSYTATELAAQIKIALENAGALTYTVVFNRADRTYTISAPSTFSLLTTSGTSGLSAYPVIGFSGADKTGLSAYTGSAAGNEYLPQFKLQDYIDVENYQKLVDPSVNKIANGRVEVVRFGIAKFFQMNIKYITDLPSDQAVIKNNPTGLADAQAFMQFLFTKKVLEFMPDIDNRAVYYQVLLESTEDDREGTSFKLKELYAKNLPNYFETGILTFRLLE